MGFLNSLLLTLIRALHSIINNYALTIILFTILIKVAVLPLNIKSRRSTMRMSALSCIARKASARWAAACR